MTSEQGHRAALQALLAGSAVVDPAALEQMRADKSGHLSEGPPLLLVEARSVEEIQTLLRYASEHRLPVVPRGAGTGLAGGAIGRPGEIVLSTRRMDRILEISVADELAVVEPGVLTADLDAALARHGLGFAPDPASRAISTVGGNIATNAGGLGCVKYGVTREAVLGLTVVLADGRVVQTGHRTVKGVAGLDLTALFVGSEGGLGVIAGATVRALPRPVGAATLTAGFASVTAAAAAATAIVSAGIRPAMLELLDARALSAIGAHLGVDLSGQAAQLIVRTDGPAAAADGERALAVIERGGGRAELAVNEAAAEELLRVRRSFHAAMEAQGEVLIEDVAVPRSRLAEMFAEIDRIEQRFGVRIPTVAHAGDGNLHPNFVIESPETGPGGVPIVPEHIWQAAGELFTAALRLGGTLTGEHGVGLLKRRWLRDELGDDSFELQRRIKEVFDPLGILNPGKVF